MKKDQIKVGGLYTARVSGRYAVVRVDRIYMRGPSDYRKDTTCYDITNLFTKRTTTFCSAAKFRREATEQEIADAGIRSFALRAQEAIETAPAKTFTTDEDGEERLLDAYGVPDAEDPDCEDEEGEQGSDPTPASTVAETPTTAPAVQPSSATATATIPVTSMFARRIAEAQREVGEVPTHTADGRKLTDQQYEILLMAKEIEAKMSGSGLRVVRIKAGAGTGKTEELRQLERVLRGSGQYTAYNNSLVADSKPKFRKAACNTTHSLAFRAVGRLYAHRLDGPRVRSGEIAQRLGIGDFEYTGTPYTKDSPEYKDACNAAGYSNENPAPTDFAPRPIKRLKAAYLAGQVVAAIDRFCQSDDRQITARTFRHIDGIDEAGERINSDRVRAYLLPFAQKAWADLSDPSGTLPFKHDVYVKVWALGQGADRPVIASDYIMLDEAQDTAPVVVGILKQQTHALVILVGDDNQEIYRWRGAENAMAHFDGAPTGMLSQSFRFGQAVADVANAVLGTLEQGTELVMRGLPAEPTDGLPGLPTRVCPVASPKCFLYRTNAGAIGRLMGAKAEEKRGHLIGKADDIIRFCRAAIDLQAKRGTDHPELGCFGTWAEVQEYSKTDEGSDLKLNVKLVDDFGAEEIIEALQDMPSEKDADLILCTAHKSKGREWPSVKLGQDFPTANKLSDEERRLLYVAATRAQEELDISECPPFCGGYDKKGGSGNAEKSEAEWIPGITINYTAPMPTAEALATYRAAKAAKTSTGIAGVPQNGTAKAVTPATSPTASVPPTPSPTANGNGEFSWANLGDAWGVRGRAGHSGKRVTVTKKNGQTSQVTLGEVARTVGEWTFYRVV